MARRELGPASLVVLQAVSALPPEPWLVACSGGADSLALAWAAGRVAAQRGTPVRAVVIDHGLQQRSAEVALAVVAHLEALPGRDGVRVGMPAEVVRVQVDDDGVGIEAAARTARYAALTRASRGVDTVLLGHTQDDQAETVLLGLARGSGVRSLAGMAPASTWVDAAVEAQLRRPLLGLSRADTMACCAEVGLIPWQDPHNDDAQFTRVRVRQRVMPVLEAELGPGVREALARTAELARRDADALDAALPVPLGEAPTASWLWGLDPAMRDRVIRAWLAAEGADELTAAHTAAVAALVTDWRGQKGVDVPGGRVIRRDGRLWWQPRQ